MEDPETDASNVVELTRSTRQLVRWCLTQYFWLPFMFVWMVWNVVTGWERHGWVIVGMFAGATALYVVATWLILRRESQSVVRLDPGGLTDGRRDGKRSVGHRPQEVPWDAVFDIRVIESRWRRTAVVYRPPELPLLLTLPRSTVFNPDPDFDERVSLIRRAWVEHRGSRPPPPTERSSPGHPAN